MKKKSFVTVLLITAAVFILTLIIRTIPAIQTVELKTIDWRFQWRGAQQLKDSPIVLVTIDDQSFESLPDRWPWPRYYYANVIQNLTKAGAAAIGLDVMLDIPDKHGAVSDQQLADAIRESGKVVLTGKLEERISVGQIKSLQFPVKPLPVLLEGDGTWGVTAIQADPDGIFRRYFAVQKYEDGYLPSFGLQILKKYLNLPKDTKPIVSDQGIEFGNVNIPVGHDGIIMIDFAGPASTFPSYSFDTVIDDDRFDLGDYDLNYFNTTLLPEGVFKDKIVLIGSTVTELHDNFPTPFFEFKDRDNQYRKVEMPGVEIHANAVWTILNNHYYRDVPFYLFLIFLFLLILFIYYLSARIHTIWSLVAAFVLIFALGFLEFYLFSSQRIVVEIVPPVIAIFLGFVSSNLHQYMLTQKEKKMIIGAFERFVPEKVVKELLDHPEKLKLGGEERFLTVIFVDLANFTAVSEKLKPAELVQLINYFLTEMTDVILKNDGIIDKYEGDAIMAEFGAPVHFEDHAVKACYAALEMQKRLRQMDLSNYKTPVEHLSCRIGINSGEMIVGNMGSRDVFDYTVMGDAVNLASRLETANKTFGTKIMLSGETFQLAKDAVIARPIDLIRVKGRQKPVRAFELIARRNEALDEKLKSMLPAFVMGIKYYHQREWKKAEERFQYCQNLFPEDKPTLIYLERLERYKLNPPGEDWDGVYTMTTK